MNEMYKEMSMTKAGFCNAANYLLDLNGKKSCHVTLRQILMLCTG
jgi:hypothetical protein